MSEIETGGSAFPSRYVHTDGRIFFEEGMTLREYFAVQAPPQRTDFTQQAAEALVGRKMPEWIPAMGSKPDLESNYQVEKAKFTIDLDAKLRVMWADSMLKALRES